jgi:hypothetical protein
MAPETYYYFFSVIAVISVPIHISNMVFFRVKHKTLIGNQYEPSTPEYKKMLRYSSASALTIAGIVELLFVANLTYDIHRILSLGKPDYAHFILPFAPIITIASMLCMMYQARNMFGNSLGLRPNKKSRKQ